MKSKFIKIENGVMAIHKNIIIIIVSLIVFVGLGIIGYKLFPMFFKETNDTTQYIFTPSINTETKNQENIKRGYSINIDNEQDNIKRGYAVSTSSDLATNVGMQVLESGGNAVDAAIAVSYTLAIVEPHASGLGGSGGLLVYDMNTQECVFYDYRATASLGKSYTTIAVPGFVAGMQACYDDYGTLSMGDLLDPAIYYAENGFAMNNQLKYRLDIAQSDLRNVAWLHNDDGEYLTIGDTVYQPEIAKVLHSIRDEGSNVFYNGWIAKDIASKTSLTLEDLESYQVYKRKAIQGYFGDYTIYSANSPLSGVTLIQMLELADELDIVNPNEDIKTYLSQLKQITSLAYGNRYNTIGDPNFYDIDDQSLINKNYIKKMLGSNYDETGYDLDEESVETTSFSIVDSNGLVVSCTNTLTQFFGARRDVDGILMNSSNNNFSESGINKYEAGKRSRTFAAPTIIVGNDGYVLSIGTPGGNNIPSRLFNVIVDILKFKEEPQDAVSKMNVIYRNGTLMLELDEYNKIWLDTSNIKESIVWKDSGVWWGSISIAGYENEKAFSAYDTRRGATMSGTYNW